MSRPVAEITLRLIVNGEEVAVEVEPGKSLLHMLREDLGHLSVKEGCSQGDCGSCIVVMNGQAVNACLLLAAQAEGAEILTLEGLSKSDRLHALQCQFAELWAFQCGFCTAGMLMSCYALLLNNSTPTRDEIRTAIEGNLCRCTSYRAVIDAVQASAGGPISHA
jgi:aerobic-type carbon monoxide dehydrogenase small subunit (CoxS/CutS family)